MEARSSALKGIGCVFSGCGKAAIEVKALLLQGPKGRCATTQDLRMLCMRSWVMQKWSRFNWTGRRLSRRWSDLQM